MGTVFKMELGKFLISSVGECLFWQTNMSRHLYEGHTNDHTVQPPPALDLVLF